MNAKRMSFKEFCENLWYHYKWLLAGAVLLAVCAALTIPQMCNKNTDTDIKILYVDKMYDTALENDICESAAKLSSDYNGDGLTDADIITITIAEAEDSSGTVIHYDKNSTDEKRFEVEVRTGDSYIYILDPVYFEKCLEYGLLEKISNMLDPADVPNGVISDYGIKISSLALSSLPGFDRCEPDAVLCFRRFVNEDEISYGRTKEDWEGNRKTFINMLKYNAKN